MVQTPVDYDPDPEPDIRRLSSSQHNQNTNQEQPNPAADRALSTPHSHYDTHNGVPDSRIERHPPILHVPQGSRGVDDDDDEKSSNNATDVTRAPSPDKRYPTIVGDKLETEAADVPVSRSSSKRPKARDFAVTNIAAPIKRATEKLVPARRTPGQQDVAFALPPATSRPGSPSPSAAAAAKARAKTKFYHGGPGFKQSFKVRPSSVHVCDGCADA
jgi:hypothetical protein